MRPVDEQSIQAAANAIRIYHAVAIVGAGASWASGLPLAADLRPLLWESLEHHPLLLKVIADRFGFVPSHAKPLIGNDPIVTAAAFETLATYPPARAAFQHGFTRLDAERSAKPSAVHDALAELLHRRAVEAVISFNWDTLLEAAYRRRYGVDLRADEERFFKPHGDAFHPERDWILPHAAGVVPDTLVDRISALADVYPRVLLVVGYSGNDEIVVGKLIAPLSDRWQVVRVSPSAVGDLNIGLPAESALPALARAIMPDAEVHGWEYVNFDRQRDLGPALSGVRLGPSDVVACPRLPEIGDVEQQLKTARAAVIVGKSGSGKSITAYQIAYDWCRQGWEILRLIDPRLPMETLVSEACHLPRRSLLIVDDAQSVDERLTRRLLEHANARLAVIVVSTEALSGYGVGVQVAAERGVATLAEALAQRHTETLSIVQELDPQVGEAYLDIPLERRLADAAKEKTPWQFSFVLTGGWRRARQQMASLRDHERADLLLGAVAAGQLVSRDAPVSLDWLYAVAGTVGRDRYWTARALQALQQQRAIIGTDVVRCPHAQYAVNVLKILCENRSDPSWNDIVRMLRSSLMFDIPALRGVADLLWHLKFADAFGVAGRSFGTVVDDATWLALVKRCWTATRAEQGGAAALLDELRYWHPKHLESLASNASLLGQWIEDANGDSAVGLGWLLNNLSQEAPGISSTICDQIDPTALASSLARAPWSDAWYWGWLIGRTAFAASKAWHARLTNALDVPAIHRLISSASTDNLHAALKVVEGVAGLNYELSLEVFEILVPVISNAISENPVETWRTVDENILYYLRYGSRSLGGPGPSAKHRRIGRRIARDIAPEAIARAISMGRRRDWPDLHRLLIFVHQAASPVAKRIVRKVDFERLDQTADGLWATMPDELLRIVWALFVAEDYQGDQVRSWVNLHADTLARLSPYLAQISPEAVGTALRKGHRLDLEVEKGWGWIPAVLALVELEQVDRSLATRVVEDNLEGITRGLASLREYDCKGVPAVLQILQELTPSLLPTVLTQIDPEVAEHHWAARLRGKIDERRAAAKLLDFAASGPNSLAEVVQGLRQQFPRATVADPAS